MDIAQIKNIILIVAMVLMGIFMLVGLIISIMGPRFTDRLIAVSAINTVINVFIVVLSVYSGMSYMVDIALVYGVIGFLAIAVLAKLYMRDYLHKHNKEIDNDAKVGER